MKKLAIAAAMIASMAFGYASNNVVRYVQKEVRHHNNLVAEYCEGDEVCYINHSW